MTDAPIKKQSPWDTLNVKQKLFVLSYIQHGLNGSKAYKDTYKIVSDDTARASSARLLAKANVKRAVQEKLDTIWKERENQAGRTLNEIMALAFSDINDIVEIKNDTLKIKDLKRIDSRAIQSIKYTETPEGTVTTSVTLHSKVQALTLLSKILNMIQDRVEHSGVIEILPAIRPKQISEEGGV